MHAESLEHMARLLERVDSAAPLSVLDVGSCDINGTYRPLVEGKGWQYTGLDLMSGPNVDVVADKPYKYPFVAGQFDVVISGNMAHCVERPWKWLPELTRVLKPGGLLAVVTIWRWGVNGHPTDHWRFLPAGLAVLFDDTGKLERCEYGMDDLGNSWGSAFK